MQKKRIGLYKTCLADMVRPSVAAATLKVLQEAGFNVVVPKSQTCCSQPAFNSGDLNTSRTLAQSIIETFEVFDYIVIPSGSCGGMLKVHMPTLFEQGSKWHERARKIANKTYEVLTFLTEVAQYEPAVTLRANITYHDSCAGLRELGIKKAPRDLIKGVKGLNLNEMEASEECCGFGGTFCVKFPPISARLADKKIASTQEQKQDLLLGGDLGCLLHICGRAQHEGKDIKAYHLIEVLAGYVDDIAPIGVDNGS